jgi:Flp pilus assembly protein TadB
MSGNCAICQISRLIAVSSGALCFAALGFLSLYSGVAVPLWVIAGFLVSLAVAIWAVASYFRQRQSAMLAETTPRGEKR